MKITWDVHLSRKQRWLKGVLATIFFILVLMPFLVKPGDLPFFTCRFYELTGHDCLTCGLTRSLNSVSHGHIGHAFGFHLFGPIIYFIWIGLFLRLSIEMAIGKKIRIHAPSLYKKGALFFLAGIWIIYWIVRLFRP
jgi:hypothetical protein